MIIMRYNTIIFTYTPHMVLWHTPPLPLPSLLPDSGTLRCPPLGTDLLMSWSSVFCGSWFHPSHRLRCSETMTTDIGFTFNIKDMYPKMADLLPLTSHTSQKSVFSSVRTMTSISLTWKLYRPERFLSYVLITTNRPTSGEPQGYSDMVCSTWNHSI